MIISMNDTVSHFSNRLADAIHKKRSPLVVGLDPRWDLLPSVFHSQRNRSDPRDVAVAFAEFCCAVIDVVATLVPAVKPQWAFFEQLGVPGFIALENIIAHARTRGLLVIADAKRGDIGTTAEAYAEAFFRLVGNAPLCDALTVNPYMGADSWQPFVQLAQARGAGVFLLAKTSNLGGGEIQDLVVGPTRVYEVVADQIERESAKSKGSCGYGIVGAVVGATYPNQLAELRARMPSAWILVPGFGAQGGTARDAAGAFDKNGMGAIVNSSRAILFAHRDPKFASAENHWQASVEAACHNAIEQLRADTNAGKLN